MSGRSNTFSPPYVGVSGGGTGNANILIDDIANRPAAADAENTLFFAEDLKYWSFSDGISWTTLLTEINDGTSGTLDLDRGGTGATTASAARTNLGLGTAAQNNTGDFDPAGAAATAQSNAQAYADGKVLDSIADSDTTHAPSRNAVFDAFAAATSYTDGKVIDSIADSDTTHAPSRNAVFDALALKAAITYVDSQDAATLASANSYADGKVIDSIADSDTTHAPSRNAVFDALVLKVPTTRTVNGHALSADVVVTAGDVGLGNVDNTSDTTKNAAAVTLTNKRITKRVSAVADATSISVNSDNFDEVTQTNTQAAGTLTLNAPTGTPTEGQPLLYRVKCTNVQTLSFNASFVGGTDIPLPSATTGSSKFDYFGFLWNATSSKWDLVSCVRGF